MKHIKIKYSKFIEHLNNDNNIIEVFHGGYIDGDITSPLYVTENEYLAQSYGNILYKFELNLNSKILDLTDLKTFKKIKSKIYDNYSELYKRYYNSYLTSDNRLEKNYNILNKYKNYDEIEKSYKERKLDDFWNKIPGLEDGVKDFSDSIDYIFDYINVGKASKEDKKYIDDFLLINIVVNNMAELNDKSLNEFGNFFIDYCKEYNYDAYKAVSSDASGRNRMIEYCIINLDIIKYIDEVY